MYDDSPAIDHSESCITDRASLAVHHSIVKDFRRIIIQDIINLPSRLLRKTRKCGLGDPV